MKLSFTVPPAENYHAWKPNIRSYCTWLNIIDGWACSSTYLWFWLRVFCMCCCVYTCIGLVCFFYCIPMLSMLSCWSNCSLARGVHVVCLACYNTVNSLWIGPIRSFTACTAPLAPIWSYYRYTLLIRTWSPPLIDTLPVVSTRFPRLTVQAYKHQYWSVRIDKKSYDDRRYDRYLARFMGPIVLHRQSAFVMAVHRFDMCMMSPLLRVWSVLHRSLG